MLIKGKLNDSVTVVNELTIDSFSRRVDLALLTDKKIIAYEIKSDADSLYRLSGQLEKYHQYFDKTVVVTTPKHLSNILKLVNSETEVWEVTGQKITIKKRGKSSGIANKADYLDLLRVQDMVKLANIIKIKLEKKSKNEIKKALIRNINKISSETIKSFVINTISKRYKLTSDIFLENVNIMKRVTIDDLEYLNAYSKRNSEHTLVKGSILDQLK